MAHLSKPRDGSLQIWPRKRAARLLPNVNYPALERGSNNAASGAGKKPGPLEFIGYKVGMAHLMAKNNTFLVQSAWKITGKSTRKRLTS